MRPAHPGVAREGRVRIEARPRWRPGAGRAVVGLGSARAPTTASGPGRGRTARDGRPPAAADQPAPTRGGRRVRRRGARVAAARSGPGCRGSARATAVDLSGRGRHGPVRRSSPVLQFGLERGHAPARWVLTEPSVMPARRRLGVGAAEQVAQGHALALASGQGRTASTTRCSLGRAGAASADRASSAAGTATRRITARPQPVAAQVHHDRLDVQPRPSSVGPGGRRRHGRRLLHHLLGVDLAVEQ